MRSLLHPDPTEQVVHLPELISIIGFHLPQEDLYACTLVCRQWHDIFISILWHTIDDTTGSWYDILQYYDDYNYHQGFDKQWLHDIFRKYGRYIRHLSAEWAPIVIAASESGICTNLLSFKTNNVDNRTTVKQWERYAQGPPSRVISGTSGLAPTDTSILAFGSSQSAFHPTPSSFAAPPSALSRLHSTFGPSNPAVGAPPSAFGAIPSGLGNPHSAFGASSSAFGTPPLQPSQPSLPIFGSPQYAFGANSQQPTFDSSQRSSSSSSSFSSVYQAFDSSTPPVSTPSQPPTTNFPAFVFGDPSFTYDFSMPGFGPSTSSLSSSLSQPVPRPPRTSSFFYSRSRRTTLPPRLLSFRPPGTSLFSSSSRITSPLPSSSSTTSASATASSRSASYTPITSTLPMVSSLFSFIGPITARQAAKRRRGVRQNFDCYGSQTLFQKQLAAHPLRPVPIFTLISPTLVGVFSVPTTASSFGYVAPSKLEQEWEVHQHIWLLVQSNLPTLRCLALDKGINARCRINKYEFLYNKLEGAKHLTELQLPQDWVDIPRLLDLVPSLQRLTTFGRMSFRAVAEAEEKQQKEGGRQQPPKWPNLRGFKYEQEVKNNELLWLLRCFPNLEDLEVRWDYAPFPSFFGQQQYGQENNNSNPNNVLDPATWLDMEAILLTSATNSEQQQRQQQHPPIAFKVARLHLDLTQKADPLLPGLLPYLPSLTELIIPQLNRDIALALVAHCPGLQIFRTDFGQKFPRNRSLRRSSGWKPDPNVPNILLSGCRHLRVFEASDQIIEIEFLRDAQNPWVCGSRLEILRCQFMGFERLDPDEKLSVETASLQFKELIFTDRDDHDNNHGDEHDDDKYGKDMDKYIEQDIEMAILADRDDYSKSQHAFLFSFLAQLHNLRILDLGPDSKSVLYNPRPPPYTTTTTASINAQKLDPSLVEEADHHVVVVSGTPSLTLEYGLAHLAALKNLQVFNFEAVDHRLEKKDVIWMATHLTGLRHVYGLQFALPEFGVVQSYKSHLDYRRTILRSAFEECRRDVRFDSQRK